MTESTVVTLGALSHVCLLYNSVNPDKQHDDTIIDTRIASILKTDKTKRDDDHFIHISTER